MRKSLPFLAGAMITSQSLAHTGEGFHMMETHMWSGFWFGNLFMITLWILAIVLIIFLVQKILQNTEKGGD